MYIYIYMYIYVFACIYITCVYVSRHIHSRGDFSNERNLHYFSCFGSVLQCVAVCCSMLTCNVHECNKSVALKKK